MLVRVVCWYTSSLHRAHFYFSFLFFTISFLFENVNISMYSNMFSINFKGVASSFPKIEFSKIQNGRQER